MHTHDLPNYSAMYLISFSTKINFFRCMKCSWLPQTCTTPPTRPPIPIFAPYLNLTQGNFSMLWLWYVYLIFLACLVRIYSVHKSIRLGSFLKRKVCASTTMYIQTAVSVWLAYIMRAIECIGIYIIQFCISLYSNITSSYLTVVTHMPSSEWT